MHLPAAAVSSNAAAVAPPLALLRRRAPRSNPIWGTARRELHGGAVIRLPPTWSLAHSVRVRCGGLRPPPGETVPDKGDTFYMRRCVDLARRAAGCTSPNPMVGCVIVKGGEVVGEGFHPKAGQPHAEEEGFLFWFSEMLSYHYSYLSAMVFALRDAGDLAENATAYVSLEPCNHYGRTPPCTEALIRAKVKRVVVGMVDPNPIVASKGVERLRDSGIEVTVGVEEALCQKLNEAYIHRMLSGKPFVALRYSLAINGGILNDTGKGTKESGGYYSQLLQEYDGVVISGCSFNQNSKLPASQEVGANQPVIIIVARQGNSPLCLPALRKEHDTRVIIFIEEDTIVDPETDKNLHQAGVERVVLNKIRLNPIIEYCTRQGFCSLLLDITDDIADFSELFAEAMEEGLLQKVITEICPVSGDKSMANSVIEVRGKPLILRDLQSRASKGSIVVEGYIA
ncbi:hypothetical protein Taro_016684 [Colocasia esculenta]|uniref:CMP/dCMP-type deaminase domain-containing protein n=1 Tax=Colocasia esculenta TaxID=4460 RepID=A0A843UP65_COLES|nr:hypothetical protein [Colocasia esculenta]